MCSSKFYRGQTVVETVIDSLTGIDSGVLAGWHWLQFTEGWIHDQEGCNQFRAVSCI
jgi:hypothetical protein